MTKIVRFGQLPDVERLAALDKALELYNQGKDVEVIASGMKITTTTLCRHLVRDREEDWKAAKKARALAEMEEAERDLKDSKDTFQVNRAATRIKAAQWQLERLYRTAYGDIKEDTASKVSITLNIGIGDDAKTVQGQVVHEALPSAQTPSK